MKLKSCHGNQETGMRIGLIGCGVVGNRLGMRLLRAGHDLTIHEKNSARAKLLLDAGAAWADSPCDLGAHHEMLISALPGPADVEAVTLGTDGLWAEAAAKTIHLETSTIGLDCARRLEQAAAARGIRFLDGPVSGGVKKDGSPLIVLWIGGNVNYFDLARPVLDILADHITYCGGVGHGQVTKLVNNLITQSMTVLIGEALALGVRSGVRLDILQTALHHGTASSRLLDEMLPLSLFSGDWTPGLRLDLALKDLRLAGDLAKEAGMELPVNELAASFYEKADSRGWGDLSAHAVARLVEEESGVALRFDEEP
jgi:3-hydroxyisobutyrate dehydrogenase-like beta-hydroxyacid dehydrogenase